MTKLSALMLARDRVELTLRAVGALARDIGDGGGELVLADHASSDGTPEIVAAAFGSRLKLRVLRLGAELAWAQAMNLAAREAAGELLLFIDNDTELRTGALDAMLGALDDAPSIAAVGPKLVYPSGHVQSAGLALPLWLVPLDVGTDARGDDHRFSFPRASFALSSSCLLVRRSAFEAAGGFHEGYRWGFESTDLAFALRKRGLRLQYEPRAVCLHEGGATLRDHPQLQATDDNRRRFLERWGLQALKRVAAYLEGLQEPGRRRFLIYGTGESGRHLANTLEIGGFEVGGFLSPNGVRSVAGYPAWNVAEVPPEAQAPVLIGSPYVREAEDTLARAGLLAGAALPILLE